MGRKTLISIIIPTYNEQNDIETTLDSLHNLSYSNLEIIIVDDSDDNTPKIIKDYNSNLINYIRPIKRGGRCEARNLGIQKSKGEILIILNADVFLPNDFIERILVHYENGTDYVLVDSKVRNDEFLFSRYIDCQHKFLINETSLSKDAMWTEGFSIKREVLLKTNLFPTGFPVPIVAGEDARLGQELKDKGFEKKIDLSIVVEHNAPPEFKEYWRIRKGRGEGTPQIRRFLDKWSHIKIIIYEILKLNSRILKTILVFPFFIECYKYLKYSKSSSKFMEIFRFFYCKVIEEFAASYGALKMQLKILNNE